MTPVQGAAGDPGIAVPPCRHCNRRLGATVEYCPFCGVGQRPPDGQSEAISPAPLMSNETTMSVATDAGVPAPAGDGKAAEAGDPGPQAVELSGEAASGPLPIPQPRKKVSALARVAWRRRKALVIFAVAIGVLIGIAMPSHRAVPPISSTPIGSVTVTAVLPNGVSDSSGTVLVAGRAAGAPGVALKQPAGTVVVGYAAPGWSAIEQRVVVVAGADTAVRLNLNPKPAHLHVATRPGGADLLIDGRAFGRTPADATLPAGRHELTISRTGYAPKSAPVSLERGEDSSMSFELTQDLPPQIVAPPFSRGVTTGATPLRSAPSADAETVQTIDADQELSVVGQVVIEGQRWLATRYKDGRTLFVPPGAAFVSWPEWTVLKKISGTITSVLRGYRFVIATKTITLYGIRPPDPSMTPAASVAYEKNLSSLGGSLTGRVAECEPYRVRLYTCLVDQRDTAELFLLDGAAVVDTDTTPEYVDMQRKAAENHRGWAQ